MLPKTLCEIHQAGGNVRLVQTTSDTIVVEKECKDALGFPKWDRVDRISRASSAASDRDRLTFDLALECSALHSQIDRIRKDYDI